MCRESGVGQVCGLSVCMSMAVGQPGPLIGLMFWGWYPSDHLELLGVMGRGDVPGRLLEQLLGCLGGGGQGTVLRGGHGCACSMQLQGPGPSHRVDSQVGFL